MKFLRHSYFALLYALPAVLFFSYYPVITLGSDTSMNFELSLPLIWLVAFDIIAFVSLIGTKRAKLSGISDRKFFLFSLFPFYATLSILWSFNSTRAFLTAGIIWLLFFAIFAIIYITPLLHPAQNFRCTLLKAFLISSAIVCVVCWLQAILDACGIGREVTLLCPGCVSQTFGFPHPSGFAIEPQFMGNLLLAPTLLALYLLIKQTRWQITLLASLFTATLFLTFSRGAIYAFAVALAVLLVFTCVRRQFRASLVIIPVTAFLFTLVAQGIFTVVGPTHGSFISGVAKSVHQLSLGIIDFRPPTTSDSPDTELQPDFDGYIAESTDIRLNLNAAALQTWFAAPGANLRTTRIGHDCPHDHPFFNDTCASYTVIKYNRQSILFGVGLGGAGTALYKNRAVTGITTPKEIVQNQPLSLLLELGLVGVILIIFSLFLAFCPRIFPARFVDGRSASVKPATTFWQHPALPLLLALIVAYLITLQFFSGLPNALQIYLLPPLLYFALQGSEKPIALSK